MGWQDAPVVDPNSTNPDAASGPSTGSAWAAAPVVRAQLKRLPDGTVDMNDPQNNAIFAAQQAADRAQYPPTGSTMDNIEAGAGKSVMDMYNGARQIGGWALDHTIGPPSSTLSDLVTGNTPSYASAANADAKDAAANDAPLMATGSGKVGYLAGSLASTVVPGNALASGAKAVGAVKAANAIRFVTMPTSYPAAITSGAVQGFLTPTASDSDSRLMNTITGGAAGGAGQGIAQGVGLIAQPVTNALAPYAQKAVDTLQNAGVPLDLAQVSGSPLLNRLRSSFSDNLGTLGAASKQADTQQTAFNQAALGTIGETADAATPDIMAAAKSRIGNVFDDVLSRNPIQYDNTLQTNLANIEANAPNVLNDQQMSPIKKQLDQIVGKAANNGGAIDGPAFQNIKQNLDTLATGPDTTVGSVAKQIRTELNNAFDRSTQANGTPEDSAALAQARQQWGNMRKIEGTIDKDGTGDISPTRLSNVFAQKANRNTSVYGQGDTTLSDLAQAGRQVLGDKMPNSGTAARIAMQLAPSAITAAGGAGYDYLHGDADPSDLLASAAKYGALGYALPKAAQMVMSSQSPWLRNYLVNGFSSPIARNALSAPSGNTMFGAAFRNLPVSGAKDDVTAYQGGNALTQ